MGLLLNDMSDSDQPTTNPFEQASNPFEASANPFDSTANPFQPAPEATEAQAAQPFGGMNPFVMSLHLLICFIITCLLPY